MKLQRKKQQIKTKKRKLDFSKFVVALYAFACIVWITLDYVLAFIYHEPVNYQTTVVIIPSIAATILGYYFKSLKEKESRNKHRLDAKGVPLELPEEERRAILNDIE